jgi:hypothetical protein
MRMALVTATTTAIIALVIGGCGGGGGGGLQSDLRSYLPMADQNSWTYDLRIRADLIVPSQEHPGWNNFVQTEDITGIAQFAGTDYFVFSVTREEAGAFPEATWTQFRRLDRHGVYARDLLQAVDLTLLQTPPTVGDTWDHPLDENVTYETTNVAAQVTVPAGTFDCVVVTMVDTTPMPDHPEWVPYTVRTWFAKGVGIVRDRTFEGPDEDMTSEIQLRAYGLK